MLNELITFPWSQAELIIPYIFAKLLYKWKKKYLFKRIVFVSSNGRYQRQCSWGHINTVCDFYLSRKGGGCGMLFYMLPLLLNNGSTLRTVPLTWVMKFQKYENLILFFSSILVATFYFHVIFWNKHWATCLNANTVSKPELLYSSHLLYNGCHYFLPSRKTIFYDKPVINLEGVERVLIIELRGGQRVKWPSSRSWNTQK